MAPSTAANRFYVDRAVADEFTARLTERLAVLAVRRGTDAGAQLGPMVGERQRRRLSELVDDARACGATIALAGGPLPGAGHFFAPVVLTDVPDEARVMREVIVGPIAPIGIVDGEADAIEQANRSDHGLAAYVYTRASTPPSVWATPLRSAWSPSTAAASRRPPPRSAASSNRASGRPAALAPWTTTWRRASSVSPETDLSVPRRAGRPWAGARGPWPGLTSSATEPCDIPVSP